MELLFNCRQVTDALVKQGPLWGEAGNIHFPKTRELLTTQRAIRQRARQILFSRLNHEGSPILVSKGVINKVLKLYNREAF